jgi:transketolase C-terminal domain/subunit
VAGRLAAAAGVLVEGLELEPAVLGVLALRPAESSAVSALASGAGRSSTEEQHAPSGAVGQAISRGAFELPYGHSRTRTGLQAQRRLGGEGGRALRSAIQASMVASDQSCQPSARA